MSISTTQFILYVADQAASTAFYAQVLKLSPTLNVPGMTEFMLGNGTKLGLMPVAGIERLLGDALPALAPAAGIPRAELYLHVDDPFTYHARALQNGAKELLALTPQDWGDNAAYSLDPDGHVLVFAAPVA